MKLSNIIIIFHLAAVALFAHTPYIIKLASYRDEANLKKRIRHLPHSVRHKIIIAKNADFTRLYSTPFKSRYAAKRALRLYRRAFRDAYITKYAYEAKHLSGTARSIPAAVTSPPKSPAKHQPHTTRHKPVITAPARSKTGQQTHTTPTFTGTGTGATYPRRQNTYTAPLTQHSRFSHIIKLASYRNEAQLKNLTLRLPRSVREKIIMFKRGGLTVLYSTPFKSRYAAKKVLYLYRRVFRDAYITKYAAETLQLTKNIARAERRERRTSRENAYLQFTEPIRFLPPSEIYQKYGTSEVHGHIAYLTPTGREIPLLNAEVYLLKEHRILNNWYENFYLKEKSFELEKIRVQYLQKTEADIGNNFSFYGVPAGSYYIIIVGKNPYVRNKKSYIAKKIEVHKYKKVIVLVKKTASGEE